MRDASARRRESSFCRSLPEGGKVGSMFLEKGPGVGECWVCECLPDGEVPLVDNFSLRRAPQKKAPTLEPARRPEPIAFQTVPAVQGDEAGAGNGGSPDKLAK